MSVPVGYASSHATRLACLLLALGVASMLFGCNRLPDELEQAAALSAKKRPRPSRS